MKLAHIPIAMFLQVQATESVVCESGLTRLLHIGALEHSANQLDRVGSSFIQLSIANLEGCHCKFQVHSIVVVIFVVVVGLNCHYDTTGVSVLSG